MPAEGLGWHYRVIGAVLGNLAKGLGSSGDGEILVGVTLATERSCALVSLCVLGMVLKVLSWLRPL